MKLPIELVLCIREYSGIDERRTLDKVFGFDHIRYKIQIPRVMETLRLPVYQPLYCWMRIPFANKSKEYHLISFSDVRGKWTEYGKLIEYSRCIDLYAIRGNENSRTTVVGSWIQDQVTQEYIEG